jgi:hypothetical protein
MSYFQCSTCVGIKIWFSTFCNTVEVLSTKGTKRHAYIHTYVKCSDAPACWLTGADSLEAPAL